MSDFAQMSDEELEAASANAYTDDTAETVESPAPATEPEQAAQPEDVEQQQQPDPAASQEQERTQRAVPVQEHMEMRRRAQEAERQAQEYQQRLDALEAQQQQHALQAEYDRLYEEVGPDAAEAYRQTLVNSQAERQQLQHRVEVERATERVNLSEQYAREAFPDYDAQIAKVVARIGAQEAYRLASQQPNPARWAYDFGKSLETPEERQAAIAAEVAKGIAEALSKQKSPPSRGQTSVGHLSATSAAGSPKSFADMTDAELEEADREARTAFR